MSEITRRDAVRRLAMALTATGLVDRLAAAEVHLLTSQAAAAAGGTYTPKTFTAAQYRALERLADLIIPVENGSPGALAARGAADFVTASPADQIALLDEIAYRRNASPELSPGIEFFALVRRMTVDAFYTSEIGIKDIDYRGNSAMGSYPAPTESIAYALKKSGL